MTLILLVIAGVWFMFSMWYWLIAVIGEVITGEITSMYRGRYGVYRGTIAVPLHLIMWGLLLPIVLLAKVVYGLVKGK